MQANRIATLLAEIDSIPTLPAIVGQVTKTIADPESSARDLMDIINSDQALTLKILKIANSAFHGRIREAGTLEQAIMVLGFDEIRNLVISAALFNNFHKLKATPLFDVAKFWKHSFVCGLAARIIAKQMKLPGSRFFVAGLMHDIGKLAICMVLPEEFGSIMEKAGNDGLETSDAELEVLGITHDEVGARLVKRWMLPQDLVSSAKYHHRPAEAPGKSAYAMVIHQADLLVHHMAAMEDPNNLQSRADFCTSKDINLTQ